VDLFEYQARDVFEKHGVPVLAAAIAITADEAEKLQQHGASVVKHSKVLVDEEKQVA